MADIAFLGMRSSEDFTVPGQRPKNWRETILRLYPNGKAPLTALLALMKSESTNDPEFNWFCKVLPTQAAIPTGWYTDAGLSVVPSAISVAGDTLYVKMSENEAKQFMGSHTVLFRSDTYPSYDVVGIVEDRAIAGASSFIRVKLLEASPQIINMTNYNRVLIIGSANPEGAMIGDAIAYDPYVVHNYTQIFRNALEITRTAEKTHLRTGDAYREAKREALELHSIEMEKAFLWGVPSMNVGSNGKPIRTTGGIIWSIKNFGGITSTFVGNKTDWKNNGMEWLDDIFMQIFRYGETEKLAFVGDGALLAINQIVREYGTWNYTTTTKAFGIQIMDLVTPFGTISMKTHPLFSHEPTNQHSMLVFEPKNIRYRYITDTTFYPDKEDHGHNRYDARKEEYLTEAGLEFHFPQNWAWVNNVGGAY